MKEAIEDCLSSQAAHFDDLGIEKLVEHYKLSINKNGRKVDKDEILIL